MYFCKLKQCIHRGFHECFYPDGKSCEFKVYGCPKCHSLNVKQRIEGIYSFLDCLDCGYCEFDD